MDGLPAAPVCAQSVMPASPVGAGHREQPLAHSCIFSCSQRSMRMLPVACRPNLSCCLKQGNQQMRYNTTSKHASFPQVHKTWQASLQVLYTKQFWGCICSYRAQVFYTTQSLRVLENNASFAQVYCPDLSGISIGPSTTGMPVCCKTLCNSAELLCPVTQSLHAARHA